MKLMDRFAVVIHHKIFGARCEKRPGIEYLTHEDFPGLIKENFSFENKEGVTLRGGIYQYPQPNQIPVVLFFHGMGGGHLAYMAEIELLCRNGYRVVSYDYYGTIASDGDSLRGFCQSVTDGEDAVRQAERLFPETPLYVMGHSWGGYTAGCVSNLCPQVKKAVLLAPPLSMPELYGQTAAFKALARGLTQLEQEQYPAYWDQQVLAHIKERPDFRGLIVQSEDDPRVKYDKTFQVLEQTLPKEQIQFLTVHEKKHNPNYTKEAVASLAAYLRQLKRAKTVEEKQALAQTAQWEKLCEQDPVVWETIIAFLR